MNIADILNFAKEAPNHVVKTIVPKIIVGGVCGAGKSSLLNAIVQGNACEIGAGKPVTRDYNETQTKTGDAPICFIDSPGFSEADKDDLDYAGKIKDLITQRAHLYLLVVPAPDRALEVESKWLSKARTEGFFSEVPGLIAINKIDMCPPVREWNPNTLNLANPSTLKERNITEFIGYVHSLKEFQPFASQGRIVPVSAGESYNDPSQYNIEQLRMKIFDLLPTAAQIEFGRQTHLRRKAAETCVLQYAGSIALEVLVNPFPISDAAIIVPIQIAMIVHLGKIYGQNISWALASSLLGTTAATLIGQASAGAVAAAAAMFIPGVKNFVGPGVAFGISVALGHTAIEIFATNKANASKEEIQSIAKKYKQLVEKAKADCPSIEVLKSKRNLE